MVVKDKPQKKLLILSDLHHRVSGVSTSIRSLMPKLADRYDLFFVSPRAQGDIPKQSLVELYRLLKQWPLENHAPVWHVRRNNEMTWGILFRTFVNRRLKLVFTNSAIRRHSLWPRWLISKMDLTMVTSRAGLPFMPDAHSVIPHGVDVEKFSNVTNASLPIPWAGYDLAIGIVGRVRPEKGTDIFVSAICKLLPEHPNACAVLVGKATAKYKKFAADLLTQCKIAGISKQVFVLDEVSSDDMPAVYKQLDIVCAPALYEGYGLVPLEAMASGTAVVASRTGAYEDMIIPDHNGFLTDCGSQQQLADALELLLCNQQMLENFKQGGSALVRQRFAIDNEIEGVCSAYERLFSKH